MEAVRAPSDVPFTFGRYETIFRIGAGGMAEVFAARLVGEAGFERLVAIKRLLSHLAEDPQSVARFLDEGRLAARVVHPHVVQTLDLGRSDEGEPFLVLELIVGSTLEELIRRPTLPSVPVTLSWLAQSAEGLHAAHIARGPDGTPLGLVHRDVSPHNILVGLDGDARISDFGIAQAVQLKTARTPTGQVTGKFAYFSPEQAMGRPLDARSDVFALGIVAWEALTGRRLFQADSPAQIFDRVRSMEVPAPHKLRSEVPQEASEAVLAALQRDPQARTPDARALARALSRALDAMGDRPSAAQRARWVRESPNRMWQRLGATLQFANTHAAPLRSRPKPRRRTGMLLAATALVGAGLYVVPRLALPALGVALETQHANARATAMPLPEALPTAPVPRSQADEGVTTDAGARASRAPSSGSMRLEQPSAQTAPALVKAPQKTRRSARRSPRRQAEKDTHSEASLPEQPAASTQAAPRAAPLLGADAFERNLRKAGPLRGPDWGGRK